MGIAILGPRGAIVNQLQANPEDKRQDQMNGFSCGPKFVKKRREIKTSSVFLHRCECECVLLILIKINYDT
jgi:hypothetical protein